MLVEEIMTKNLKTATPEFTLMEVAELMRDSDCGSIPVVKSEKDKKAVGIITDRDIVVRAVAEGADMSEAEVGEYMTSSTLTVSPGDTVEDCLEMMETEKVRRVIVVDREGNCIGIVSQAKIALNVPGRVAGELLQEISR
jgi:CBS domain-containing protein